MDRQGEERVNRLEDMMAEVWRAFAETDRRLAHQSERTDRQIERTAHELERLSREMREFKNEIRSFEYEMSLFKDRVDTFRDAMYTTLKSMNKKWGELANKMGTLVEDLVAPSIPDVLYDVVRCPEYQTDMVTVHMRRRHPLDHGRSQEFDVVAVCGEYVLINETRSRLNVKDVDDFVDLMSQARDFFPEYADRHFIGALASLYVDESVVRYGQNQGLLILGLGDDLMKVLNEPGFEPRKF